MKTDRLIELFREEADDLIPSFLWKDPILLRYIDQAQREAARRARILNEAVNPDVCVYSVPIGKPWVKLHESVITITHAQFEYPNPEDPTQILVNVLGRKHKKDMDDCHVGWRTDSGEIIDYITDTSTGYVQLYRIPDKAGKLRIECTRTPLKPICKPDDCLEIPDRYCDDLVYWMLYKAYSKRDAETFDANAAAKNLTMFESIFGKPSTPADELWVGNLPNLRSPHVTKYY